MSTIAIAAIAITGLILLLVIMLGYIMLGRYVRRPVQIVTEAIAENRETLVDPEAQILPDLSPQPSEGMQAIAEQVKAQGLPLVPPTASPVPMPATNVPVDPNPSVDVPQVSISDDNSEMAVRSDSIPPGRLIRDRRYNRNRA